MRLVDSAKPKPLARDLDRALYLAQQKLLELGITTIADMGTTIEEWQAYRRAGDKKQLAVRIISYGGDIENMAINAGNGPTPWIYEDRRRLVGGKLYLDSTLGPHGLCVQAPYGQTRKKACNSTGVTINMTCRRLHRTKKKSKKKQ